MARKKFLIASTGGSGAGYLIRLLFHMRDVDAEIHWVATDNFWSVMRSEFGFDFRDTPSDKIMEKVCSLFQKEDSGSLPLFKIFSKDDLGAPPASGSASYEAMVILPCSMKTLASVAGGMASNLIERAADVSLKENRKLVLVIRESPYNLVHVENMKKAILAGAVVMPASPGFYHRPRSIDEIYDFMVDRVFLHMGIQKRLLKPWGED